MSLPDLTALQFLILQHLLHEPMSGRALREELAGDGEKKTGPAFYQLMARMEDAGYVKGWYEQKIVEGQIIRERRYEITPTGVSAWETTRAFYLAHERGIVGGFANG